MTTKATRGKASKVDLLPEDIKKSLIEGLRDRSISQTDLLDAINQMIDSAGLPEDMSLSRSGLNRYATKMEEVGARIRQAREVSKQWTAELGDKPTTEVGKILREIVRTLGFEVGSAMMDNDASKIEPKALNQLALLSVRLEDAESKSLKREQEIQQAFAKVAAEQAATVARAQGMTAEGAEKIKREILGIA
jgi:hypothetical protein